VLPVVPTNLWFAGPAACTPTPTRVRFFNHAAGSAPPLTGLCASAAAGFSRPHGEPGMRNAASAITARWCVILSDPGLTDEPVKAGSAPLPRGGALTSLGGAALVRAAPGLVWICRPTCAEPLQGCGLAASHSDQRRPMAPPPVGAASDQRRPKAPPPVCQQRDPDYP
jgi:hypothetical protein